VTAQRFGPSYTDGEPRPVCRWRHGEDPGWSVRGELPEVTAQLVDRLYRHGACGDQPQSWSRARGTAQQCLSVDRAGEPDCCVEPVAVAAEWWVRPGDWHRPGGGASVRAVAREHSDSGARRLSRARRVSQARARVLCRVAARGTLAALEAVVAAHGPAHAIIAHFIGVRRLAAARGVPQSRTLGLWCRPWSVASELPALGVGGDGAT
jgi:hypothetical protein